MNTKITINNYNDYYKNLQNQFKEFAQRKSDFQIEKFIACSDSLIPSHQYRHVLVQMRIAMTELKHKIIERERNIRKINKSNLLKPSDYDLDILESETEIESLGYDIDSKLIEVNKYAQILEVLEKENGKPFTNEEYQMDEPEYWKQRFARQLHDAVIDRETGCGQGNLIAMREAYYDTILPNSMNIINELPMNITELNLISKGLLKR